MRADVVLPGQRRLFPESSACHRPQAFELLTGKLAGKLVRTRHTLVNRRLAYEDLVADRIAALARGDEDTAVKFYRKIQRKLGDIRRAEDDIAAMEAEIKSYIEGGAH